MSFIREWVFSITLAAMIVALAEGMIPAGPIKRAARILSGLVLMIGILQPVVRADFDEIYCIANADLKLEIAEQGMGGDELMKTIIEARLSVYALDKACRSEEHTSELQ